MTIVIKIVAADEALRSLGRFADLLRDSVERGALVGFVLPFDAQQAERHWRQTFRSMADGERVLICAMADGAIVGTVQLYLAPEPNAPHRAEVNKLLVHHDFQGRGIGTALMLAVEAQALHRQRSLLLLDTVQGGAGERLYRRLGWREIGVVPRHFFDPAGKPQSSVYFMRHLDSSHDPHADDRA